MEPPVSRFKPFLEIKFLPNSRSNFLERASLAKEALFVSIFLRIPLSYYLLKIKDLFGGYIFCFYF
jgi:hypothetical protein